MDGPVDARELVARLDSDEDGVRKWAAFKLMGSAGDPSFADIFVLEGGLPKLRRLILNSTGNTLGYGQTAFSRLLEVDKGWDYIDEDLVKRVVEVIVTQPLVHILRPAMTILNAVVSHQPTPTVKLAHPEAFGFRAIKPAIAAFPQFLELLVGHLSQTDHTLIGNALQLINSLMRDAVTSGTDNEWPKFIKRLQDLGVIRSVYTLMQGSALQDLAQPLLEFQALTKVLLRKWRDVEVDFNKPEHRRALRVIHQASKDKDEKDQRTSDSSDYDIKTPKGAEKFRRLGFQSADDFNEVGFLGMMDFSDFVRRTEDGFPKLILEQDTQPVAKRCPVAKASIAVTGVLYEHFEVDKSEIDDAKAYLALDSRSNIDKLFSPMLMQWSRIHTAGLQAFFRLWKVTGAEIDDFGKITDLIRILLEAVVGGASRAKEISVVEDEIQSYECQRLRELQMELFELSYEDTWGRHLGIVRENQADESLQFVKEQRIRCLLGGSWFPLSMDDTKFVPVDPSAEKKWRFVRLSHNRRWLHFADFELRESKDPDLADLSEKIDLSQVSSVVSNISQTVPSPTSSNETLHPPSSMPTQPQTRILINGLANRKNSGHGDQKHHRKTSSSVSRKELPLLALYPLNNTLASEWLDGLLMLLNQNPITPDTAKLLKIVSSLGLKIRLLNVRFEEGHGPEDGEAKIPTREGLDEDYYYGAFGDG